MHMNQDNTVVQENFAALHRTKRRWSTDFALDKNIRYSTIDNYSLSSP